MPVSNETRVRVDDLEKINAQVWPASGMRSRRARSRLNTTVSRRIFSNPPPAIFPMTINVSSFVFGNFPPKGSLLNQAERNVTSFSSPRPPRTRDTTTPWCDADARFRRTRAILSASALAFFVSNAKTRAHTEIIHGQNVKTAKLKNQKHFHRPTPDAANFRQPRNNFIV